MFRHNFFNAIPSSSLYNDRKEGKVEKINELKTISLQNLLFKRIKVFFNVFRMFTKSIEMRKEGFCVDSCHFFLMKRYTLHKTITSAVNC